ncbi:MAG: Ig-like domain-containing protein [Myxococcales bacterium]|nr:Ig-like domain-containing protein [Myxococcales bacterium]
MAQLSCRGTLEGKQQVAFAPSQTQSQGPIEVRFYEPVVTAEQVGTPIAAGDISIEPSLEFTAQWRDRQTLVIETGGKLVGSTAYRVKTLGALAALTKGYEFSFIHQPLVVYGITSRRKDSLPTRGEFALAFNQDVNAADVAGHCHLLTENQTKLPVVVADGQTKSDVVVLRAKDALAKNTSYRMACRGLAGAAGPAPMVGEYLEIIKTRPDFAIAETSPTGGSEVDPDETTVEITFSTPVSLEAVRKAITTTPALEGANAGWLSDDYTYRFSGEFDTNTKYRVALTGLKDVDGEALPRDFQLEFATGDAKPNVTMDTGIFVLEGSAKGYPIWSRNVTNYDIACAPIAAPKLASILTADIDWQPYPTGPRNVALAWTKLGLVPAQHQHTVTGSPNRWQRNDLNLGQICSGGKAGAKGVYLAELHAPQVPRDEDRPWRSPQRQRVLINVTDMGVLLKVGGGSSIAWVTDLATGAPQAGVAISLFDKKGKSFAQAVTDDQGLARLPGSSAMAAAGASEENWYAPTIFAVAQKGDDTAVVSTQWNDGMEAWNFDISSDRLATATRIRGFIQSDRGIYRPGDTVHFKGIARQIAKDAPPRVPAAKNVAVEISDSRGTVISKQTLKLSKYGGFGFDLPLIADAALGDYAVRAKLENQTFVEYFSVEEYRPVTFELGITGKEGGHRLGMPLEASLKANYLFGAPVDDAEVAWSVRRRNKWVSFPGFDGFSFEKGERWYEEYSDEYGDFIEEGSGRTDAAGNFALLVKDGKTEFDGPQDYVVEMRVTDASTQTVAKSSVIAAYYGDYVLGVRNENWVAPAGKPFTVELVALDEKGTPVTTTARLSLVRSSWECRRIGMVQMRSDCEEKQTVAMVKDLKVTGITKAELVGKLPGSYSILIESKDSRGRSIAASSGIWLTGAGEGGWAYSDESKMKLIANKRDYKIGDTATIVAQSDFKRPTALLTIERDGIIEASVQRLDSASQAMMVPIKDQYAPNVFASIAFVKGRTGAADEERPRLQMGMATLPVDASSKELTVDIKLDRAEVKPGELVTGTITVSSRGKPVQAELSLAAADEGVLQLINYQTPNPMKRFYAPFGLGVDSSTNLGRIARLRDKKKDADGDEGGDAGSNPGRVRSKFVASAYWKAAVVTDAKGVATFSFNAPDNLTAYRVMAVAADIGERFGASDKRFTVKKPLMAMPALARVYQPGDQTSIGVVVHNYTGTAGTAKVVASVTGLTLAASTKEVKLPASGSVAVYFPATVSDVKTSTVGFAVSMGAEQDAVQLEIPVRRPRTVDIKTAASGKIAGGAFELPLRLGAGTIASESEVRLTIDRTGMADLEPALRYLVEYPYGCLEQTLSRFIPLTKAKDLAEQMGIESLPKAKVDEFLAAGLAKVVRHQQYNGHFSLWPDSEPYPHLTAYAIFGLREAQKAGLKVDTAALDRAYDAMRQYLGSREATKDRGDLATAAMGAYLLAERGKLDAKIIDALWDKRATMPAYGLAFLWRALAMSKASPARLIEARLLVLQKLAVGTTSASAIADTWTNSPFYMTSDTRATAMILAAVNEIDPTSDLVPKLVHGLREARRGSPYWNNTQENLWSLIAIADVARRTADATATVTIKLGGRVLATQVIAGNKIFAMSVPGKDAKGTLRLESSEPLHYGVRLVEVKRDPGDAVAQGFTITREYLSVKGVSLPRAASGSGVQVLAGQPVRVRLTIKLERYTNWIAVVDPLPGGLEAVNPRLATSEGGGDGEGGWQWSHSEMRDDRVMWFADRLSPGTHTLEYLTRATTDGTFTNAPATVEAMYQPELRGRTAASTLVVTR